MFTFTFHSISSLLSLMMVTRFRGSPAVCAGRTISSALRRLVIMLPPTMSPGNLSMFLKMYSVYEIELVTIHPWRTPLWSLLGWRSMCRILVALGGFPPYHSRFAVIARPFLSAVVCHSEDISPSWLTVPIALKYSIKRAYSSFEYRYAVSTFFLNPADLWCPRSFKNLKYYCQK